MCQSLMHTPAALTCTRTSFAFGGSCSRSRICRGLLTSVSTAARMSSSPVLSNVSLDGETPPELTAFAHSTVQRTCAPGILADLKLIEHKYYASLTNDMCLRFNLLADVAIIEDPAKGRSADLDDARGDPARVAGADPTVPL